MNQFPINCIRSEFIQSNNYKWSFRKWIMNDITIEEYEEKDDEEEEE